MVLDQFVILRAIEPPHQMKSEALMAAIGHLNRALQILQESLKALEEGIFDLSFSQRLDEAWLEVNKCRLYTETILFIEETLIPAMGEIYSAKSMFDSLIAWNLGMTRSGYISIATSIQSAQEGIGPCLEELESWLPARNKNLPETQH